MTFNGARIILNNAIACHDTYKSENIRRWREEQTLCMINFPGGFVGNMVISPNCAIYTTKPPLVSIISNFTHTTLKHAATRSQIED